jgi:menaquinone-dependent protoporphyrinogen oxidase
MDDARPVLVAYASRHEATREIAAAIAERLIHHGLAAEARDVADVADLSPYGAVVLGSAVYIGRWLKPARAFADTHAAELRERRVWLFSSGPIGDPPKPDAGAAVDIEPIVAATGALEHHLFAGRLDRGDLGLRERVVIRAVGAPEGDFRDWDQVRSFADRIAAALTHGG